MILFASPGVVVALAGRHKVLLALLAGAGLALALSWALGWWPGSRQMVGVLAGNGRLEATQVDVATVQGGRLDELWVHEGEAVVRGQLLARMQTDTLKARYQEALAARDRAEHGVLAAQALVALRASDVSAARATVTQREAELLAARQRLERTDSLAARGAASRQELDDDRARVRSIDAARLAAEAQVLAATAAVAAAKAEVSGAQAAVAAAEATLARVGVDMADAELRAPRDGRVQYLLAQPGEVLAPGGRVLSLVDLTDVYMTFFLPEAVAGRMALGSEVRLVLDAAPAYVIPAELSFVSSVSQFTPRTVETASERQKLMFRVRARIPASLLVRYAEQVKTGLPGVAWVRTEPHVEWPAALAIRLPEPSHDDGA